MRTKRTQKKITLTNKLTLAFRTEALPPSKRVLELGLGREEGVGDGDGGRRVGGDDLGDPDDNEYTAMYTDPDSDVASWTFVSSKTRP